MGGGVSRFLYKPLVTGARQCQADTQNLFDKTMILLFWQIPPTCKMGPGPIVQNEN
jgi:hypothetical protein